MQLPSVIKHSAVCLEICVKYCNNNIKIMLTEEKKLCHVSTLGMNWSGTHVHSKTVMRTYWIYLSIYIPVDKIESFCHKEKDTDICFSIRARQSCRDCIRTCMRLTKPKRINLGCFRIPLLAAGSENVM